MKDEFKMGLRSLAYRRKQYVSLLMVTVFGVAISLFTLFLIKGMISSLKEKAKIYYGGDYQFVGETPWLCQLNFEEKEEALKSVFPSGVIISPRFDLDGNSISYYFEGSSVRQRVLKGVDFNKEKKIFDELNYIEGSAEGVFGTNGVILSYPIAKQLNVHVGDEAVLMLSTSAGYLNTVPVIVKGIFKDSSLFGMYTSYLDIHFLLDSYAFNSEFFNRLCISNPGKTFSKKDDIKFQTELEKKFPMYPLSDNKQAFYNAAWSIEMPTYALIPLSANLQDLQILIDAMGLIAGFVILILTIIIVAGVSSTFRVIVMKRINEIGIYKAIGMKRQKIMGMLLVETLLLLLTGCGAGFLLSLILCKVSSLFNLSFIPAFDIFLTNGYLAPVVSGWFVLLVCGVVCVTTLVAVMFSVRKSVRITPCEALAVNE